MGEMIPPRNEQGTNTQGHNGELPEGWVSAKLPKIAKINMGQSPPGRSYNNRGDGLPFFQGKADFGDRYPTVRVWCSQPKKIAHPGDVLISVRAPVGPTNVADRVCAIGRGLAAIAPLGEIPSEIILFRLRVLEPELALSGTGSTFSAISRKDIEEIDIDVPPLAEQKRIVAEVKELLTSVNSTKNRLAKVSLILKRFRQAVLAAACSGRLTADWREKHPEIEAAYRSIQKLKERNKVSKLRRDVPTSVNLSQGLTEYQLPTTWMLESTAALLLHGALIDVKDGNHGSNHPKRGEFCNVGCPFITAAQVKNYRIDYEGAPKVTGEPLKRLRVGFAEIGDAILTHKGSVGRAALNTQSCVLTPQTTYYRCNREVLDPRYLVYFLTSPQFFQQLAGVMSQTTRDFVPISEQYHLFIFLPPLTEQQEIIRRVDAMFKLADVAEKRVGITASRTEKLTQAILAKASRGELVLTEAELARREGRPYETASELLSRIKSDKEMNEISVKLHHKLDHKKRSK
jgi:type I restriction enzyme S subunit